MKKELIEAIKKFNNEGKERRAILNSGHGSAYIPLLKKKVYVSIIKNLVICCGDNELIRVDGLNEKPIYRIVNNDIFYGVAFEYSNGIAVKLLYNK